MLHESSSRSRRLTDPAATEQLAEWVANQARPGDAILLHGPLGAGKTAFARAFLRAAADDPGLEVPSPTYTILQSYQTRLGPVHHFDLWRAAGPADLHELGWDDARRDIVLVEWPERLGPLRPAEALSITFAFPIPPAGPDSRLAVLDGWTERGL